MKRGRVKEYVLTVLQLPLVCAEVLFAYAGYVLARVVTRLGKCRTALMRRTLGHCGTSSEQDAEPPDTSIVAPGIIYALLMRGTAKEVRRLREHLERTPEGGAVADRCRKLYAVASPTKDEDKMRIRIILWELSHKDLHHVVRGVEEVLTK